LTSNKDNAVAIAIYSQCKQLFVWQLTLCGAAYTTWCTTHHTHTCTYANMKRVGSINNVRDRRMQVSWRA